MSFIQGPEEEMYCGWEVEGKRTSWIATSQQLGFIYIQGLLLTKLPQSYLSNIV